MTWLIVVLVLAVLVLAWLALRPPGSAVSDETGYRALVALHVIRRRLEVAQLKAEVRRDAAWLRRELRRELEREAPDGRGRR